MQSNPTTLQIQGFREFLWKLAHARVSMTEILEFAKLDLDISAACIKGKKPTATIMAIHMFCLA